MPRLQIRPLSAREERIIPPLEESDEHALKVYMGQRIGDLEYGEDPERATDSWLQRSRDQLRLKICIEGEWCKFISENRNRSRTEIVAALADVVATIAGGIPVYTLASLLLRSGLDAFCECQKDKPQAA